MYGSRFVIVYYTNLLLPGQLYLPQAMERQVSNSLLQKIACLRATFSVKSHPPVAGAKGHLVLPVLSQGNTLLQRALDCTSYMQASHQEKPINVQKR